MSMQALLKILTSPTLLLLVVVVVVVVVVEEVFLKLLSLKLHYKQRQQKK